MKEDLIRSIGKSNNKEDSSAHVKNKILPVSDSTSSSSSLSSSSLSSSNADDHQNQQQCRQSDEKKDKGKINSNSKSKTLSRMKELFRWAAATTRSDRAKFGRKVLHFRNKSAIIKTGVLNDDGSRESPKISLKWEVESCNTTCSTASAPPSIMYDESIQRKGNWITSDDEFVVLEL